MVEAYRCYPQKNKNKEDLERYKAINMVKPDHKYAKNELVLCWDEVRHTLQECEVCETAGHLMQVEEQYTIGPTQFDWTAG